LFRRKTVAAKRDRSCPGRLQIVPDLAGRRRRFWAEAAGLFEESWKVRSATRISQSAERTHQRGGCFDDRLLCCSRLVDEIVRRSSQETNRRRESAHRFGFVRREDLQIGPQRQTGEVGHCLGREHGAIARVSENSHYAEGIGKTGGKNTPTFAESYGAIE